MTFLSLCLQLPESAISTDLSIFSEMMAKIQFFKKREKQGGNRAIVYQNMQKFGRFFTTLKIVHSRACDYFMHERPTLCPAHNLNSFIV